MSTGPWPELPATFPKEGFPAAANASTAHQEELQWSIPGQAVAVWGEPLGAGIFSCPAKQPLPWGLLCIKNTVSVTVQLLSR